MRPARWAAATSQGLAKSKAAIPAIVRVEQVGYATDATKHAFLMPANLLPLRPSRLSRMVAASSPPATCVPTRGLEQAVPAHLRRGLRRGHRSRLLRDPRDGRYERDVSRIPIGEPAELFAPLLANTLLFYQTQRDGPNVIGDVFPALSHLHDRRAQVYFRTHYNPDFTIKDPVPGAEGSPGSTSRAVGSMRVTTACLVEVGLPRT